MKLTKKILSVLLALSMLVGVFSVMAFALAPDSAVDLIISTDKTTYAPGDIVTIKISEQVIADVGRMCPGGQYPIAYNSAVLQPLSTTSQLLGDHNVTAIAGGIDMGNSRMKLNTLNQGDKIDAESAAKYGWNALIAPMISDDYSAYDCTDTPMDILTFQMQIPTEALAGTYTIGYNPYSFTDECAMGFSMDEINMGIIGQIPWFDTTQNYGLGTCTFTVGSTGLEVNHVKNQIRFDNNADKSYAGTFDYRILAGIPKASFDEILTDEATAKTAIKEIGFIFAYNANIPGGFDTAAAQALAKSADTASGNYAKKTVDFLQQPSANNGNNYVFSCIVTDMDNSYAQDNKDITAYAYVAYDTGDGLEYAFFEAGVKSTFKSHFTSNWDREFTPGTCPVK